MLESQHSIISKTLDILDFLRRPPRPTSVGYYHYYYYYYYYDYDYDYDYDYYYYYYHYYDSCYYYDDDDYLVPDRNQNQTNPNTPLHPTRFLRAHPFTKS